MIIRFVLSLANQEPIGRFVVDSIQAVEEFAISIYLNLS